MAIMRAVTGDVGVERSSDGDHHHDHAPPGPDDVVNADLQLDLEGLPGVLVARPQGDIDMAVAPGVERDVLDAVARHRPACVVVDLSAVTYIDSSGIRLLFRLYAALAEDPSRLIVVAPPGSSAERLLGLVALGDIGDVRPSVASALEACQGHAH